MIAIPDPCHEDFSKMTPTQRGAFCQKCKIDTFDFRHLSDLEINQLLLKHKGEHLCGQFSKKQLESLNEGYLNWRNQHPKTFKSKFLLALVLVFGLSLFSCSTQEEQAIIEMQKIELNNDTGGDIREKEYVNQVRHVEELDLVDYVEEKIEEIHCEMPGIIDIGEEPVPEEYGEMVINGEAIVTEYLGGAMVATNYWDYLDETVALEVDSNESILPDQSVGPINYFEAKAFPNPTQSISNLALDVKETAQFDVQLFDFTGRLVQEVHHGELVIGRQNFSLDLSSQPSGMYFVRILAKGQDETIKIQKVN